VKALEELRLVERRPTLNLRAGAVERGMETRSLAVVEVVPLVGEHEVLRTEAVGIHSHRV